MRIEEEPEWITTAWHEILLYTNAIFLLKTNEWAYMLRPTCGYVKLYET